MPKITAKPKSKRPSKTKVSSANVRSDFDRNVERLRRLGIPEVESKDDSFVHALATFFYGSERFMAVEQSDPKGDARSVAQRRIRRGHYERITKCVENTVNAIESGDAIKSAKCSFDLCCAMNDLERVKSRQKASLKKSTK
jgi:hypothetical protein